MTTLSLAPAHADQLQQSAISQEIISARGYRSIAPGAIDEWRDAAGDVHSDELLRKVLHQGGLAFPLYRVAGESPFTWVLRPDLPRTNKDGKPIKYEYPRYVSNILDVLPRYKDALGDPNIPLWITEGCKKADALASAYGAGIVPVNENGVWGWRTKGKLLDDFSRIVWEGRRVIVAPDGDVRHNKAVYQAVQRSARLFIAWGAAEVRILLLPCEKDGPKIGVDDYLGGGHTTAEVESHLVDLATVGEQARVSLMKHPTTGAPLFLPPGYETNFATGCYGNPLLKPLRVQCASKGTTTKGILQTIAQVNGVPMHLEDTHLLMAREPDNFAGLIYDFANGQLRTYGQLNQQAGGGGALGGTLICTGEATPEFTYEGSQRRVLLINCKKWWPLGAEPKSDEGGRRAGILASAWLGGAGLWGHQTCETIWANWENYRRESLLLAADPTLSDLQAWRLPLAAASIALRIGMHQFGLEIDWMRLLMEWGQLYCEGQRERDPSRETFEKALIMLSQCELVDNSDFAEGHKIAPSWQWLHYERKMVAARRVGDPYWRVLSTSPQWRAVVGVGAVDMFGDDWLKNGFILPPKRAGRVSDSYHTGPGKGSLQCILVPDSELSVKD